MSKISSRVSLLVLAFCLTMSCFAAGTYPVEVTRNYTAAGAFTSSVSGATNASPIVITTSAAHNLVTGDQVRILSVGGNTNANGLWYVSVASSTTFSLYSDSGLSVASSGNSAYTSGGTVTQAYDVSNLTGDFTLVLRLDSLTAGKTVLVSIQESEDGFASDIRTIWTASFVGPTTAGPSITQSLRRYQLPDNRFGASGTYGDAVRVYVQAIDSSATAQLSFFLQY